MHQTKDFFISYGRRESLGFVARLHRALILEGYTGWFDKVNIPDGEDYARRINNGIESADNFVFVMAPRCLTSPYCLIELEYARVLGKRIIPVNQMVIFQTDDQELSGGDQAVLRNFYKANGIPDQNITTTQQVLDRSLAVVGTTDWLDGKQNLSDDACEALRQWAATYENSWHNHEDIAYLKNNEIPTFGEVTDSTESIVERIKLVAEKQKPYVQQHTQLTLEALYWANNQRSNNHLLVGKERKAAEEWLLTEFTPPKQPPCTPSDLLCEFIGEARKNAENRMTDVFVCYATEDKAIRNEVIKSLARHAVTTWIHDKDIQKSAAYDKAIEAGIDGADNFFFFISPASVRSDYCLQELEHALAHNKRLVPLLIKPTPEADMPASLRGMQYVDFTDNTDQLDFSADIDELLNVLNHDKSYYEEHKLFLVRALEWERSGRKNSFLLRGFNLENANAWLRIHEKREEHPPLDLHREFILASDLAKGQLNTEVFISYSRKDGDFARKLNQELQRAGKTTWFDQESISTGVDFEKEIFKGIEGANNIVFLLSPDSVQSEYCEREVEYANSLNKRFIPVLVRSTEPEDIPEVLRVINWIDFTGTDFQKPFTEVIKAIEIDREHANYHTVLQQRASEWLPRYKSEEKKEEAEEYLLNNSAYQNAIEWLKAGAESKKPAVTQVQKDYIKKSGEVIAALEAREKAVAKSLRKRLQFAGVALGVAVILLFVAGYFMREHKIADESTVSLLLENAKKRRNALDYADALKLLAGAEAIGAHKDRIAKAYTEYVFYYALTDSVEKANELLRKVCKLKGVPEKEFTGGYQDALPRLKPLIEELSSQADYERYRNRYLPQLVPVKGGRFDMGCIKEDTTKGDSEYLCKGDEVPIHSVSLSDYQMAKYEVTVAQYLMFCKATGHKLPPVPGWGWQQDEPIVFVSWFDAMAYSNYVSDVLGLEQVYTLKEANAEVSWDTKGIRIPTEAEWEYAAKGGQIDKGKYLFSGSDNIKEVAWYNSEPENGRLTKPYPVGSKKPNGLGLYDMGGNAREWCWDKFPYSRDYPSEAQVNPKGTDAGFRRITRGGSWSSGIGAIRVSYRGAYAPGDIANNFGIRVVMPLE